jgi:hypothetical protein
MDTPDSVAPTSAGLFILPDSTESVRTSDQPNPFGQDLFSPIGLKQKLKYKDQNIVLRKDAFKPPRPTSLFDNGPQKSISHWNQRKGLHRFNTSKSLNLKNPIENDCDYTFGKTGQRVCGQEPPLKMRRSMTFAGSFQTIKDEPCLDFFCQPEPLIPSFLEHGKDMIRRISAPTVKLSNIACRYT